MGADDLNIKKFDLPEVLEAFPEITIPELPPMVISDTTDEYLKKMSGKLYAKYVSDPRHRMKEHRDRIERLREQKRGTEQDQVTVRIGSGIDRVGPGIDGSLVIDDYKEVILNDVIDDSGIYYLDREPAEKAGYMRGCHLFFYFFKNDGFAEGKPMEDHLSLVRYIESQIWSRKSSYVVYGHGSEKGMSIGIKDGRPVSYAAEVVAKLIRADSSFAGKERVILYACGIGRDNEEGGNFAQNLANILRIPVSAPNMYLLAHPQAYKEGLTLRTSKKKIRKKWIKWMIVDTPVARESHPNGKWVWKIPEDL